MVVAVGRGVGVAVSVGGGDVIVVVDVGDDGGVGVAVDTVVGMIVAAGVGVGVSVAGEGAGVNVGVGTGVDVLVGVDVGASEVTAKSSQYTVAAPPLVSVSSNSLAERAAIGGCTGPIVSDWKDELPTERAAELRASMLPVPPADANQRSSIVTVVRLAWFLIQYPKAV